MKRENVNDYITAHEAAMILSNKYGRRVDSRYISKMTKMKKHHIKVVKKRDRWMYRKSDIEACVIGGSPVAV